MEARMRVGCGAWIAGLIVAGCLMLTLPVVLAQKAPAANSVEAERASLAEKARALEARGRPDLAAQQWQQILLSAPENHEALVGLARDYKLMGSADESEKVLDRLRRINRNDPDIARIESMPSTSAASEQLRQAGELARQGRNEDAMRIYRQLYGDQPPNGDIALAYYETLYGTAGGKQEAVAGMRALVERNPGDPRYAIALGKMLTYDARSRDEGMRLLKAHPGDPGAQAALRQALIWNAANPASAPDLRDYLKAHPQDAEIAQALKKSETTLAQMNSGIARTPEEHAAFAALNAHHLDDAERRFTALLDKEPGNGRVAAGMGFLRMQQKNFAGAISYLSQAEQDGYREKIVVTALAQARFFFTMDEAAQAFAQNQLDAAAEKYRVALEMNPRSADALNGLAGVYIKGGQYGAAANVEEQLIHLQPASLEGWRGLFLAFARANQSDKALAVAARFPARIRVALNQDPEFLGALAAIYESLGRSVDAQRVLAQALALPFPGNGATLLAGTRLNYAGILMQARHYTQAAALYSQVLAADPGNVSAWEGLISAYHELAQDTDAIAAVERMPAAAYETALGDAAFLSELGAIYQNANQYEVAQGLLERAGKLDIAAGRQPSVSLELQLAGIYLLRNNTDQAYAIYRQVLTDHPDRADAWKGLIATLTATNRNDQALEELAQIPALVLRQLDSDIDFLQTEAGVYATAGSTARALQLMDRVQAYYAKARQLPPPSVDVQSCWLLYNTGNDRALYVALMRIGGRNDLTLAQRETVQDIWADWSVRRAAAAMDNGYASRAIDILDAAALAFPNNLTVRKAVAGGYARVGRAREALALFKTVPMQDASAGDFEGAVGAALAANDRNQAELWLRQALERFGTDPAILSLAARYEQARGDNERAADYYRASLAAMPQVSPADRLAHVLVYPDQDTKPHRAVTAADLQHLLDPDYEPFAKTTRLPPVPSYGPDPYSGGPPVVVPQSPSAPQAPPASIASPDSHDLPLPPVPHAALEHPSAPSSSRSHESGFAGARLQPCRQTRKNGGTLAPERRFFIPSAQTRNKRSGFLVLASVNLARPPARTKSASLRLGSPHLTAMQAAAESYAQVPITLNPPHSLASDTWKGLIFSLMAGNRTAEALDQLSKIPPDVRRQLEADIEWVQGIASLYYAVGDSADATAYLRRVENFYLLHRASAPANLEVQHAWLLYNLRDDVALYPLLQRLDSRVDLTADQRQQLDTLWADWAVRRANEAMDAGHLLRAVELLQAASQDYPDNLVVRLAVAGAYARVGRAQDAVTLYKSIDLSNAAVGDFQGAISAALTARDMAQAEGWLRVALAHYPNDPVVLGLAARFEQARGNNERASDFWRAALAAMPPGSSVKSLDYGLGTPGVAARAPAPGDTRRLLDPRLDPLPTPQQLAPLPSYKSQTAAPLPAAAPIQPAQPPPITAPSNNPLPLPSNSSYAPGRGTLPAYTPPAAARPGPPSAPVLVEQSATQPPVMHSATGVQPAAAPPASVPPRLDQFTGKIHLPPSEETIAAIPEDQAPRLPPPSPAPVAPPPANRRITAQPMGPVAAQAQAGFADQTDSQLTSGSAAVIRNVPNAPVAPIATAPPPSAPQGTYNVAQYTPSAQEAATGAYSAPQQQPAAPQPTPAAPATPPATTTAPPAKPSAAGHAAARKRKKKAAQQPAQTLGNAPIESSPLPEPPPQTLPPAQAGQPAPPPEENPQQTTGTGLSDQELEQRNLPPLRGPWVRTQRQGNPVNPRDEAEAQLHAIESGYSGWLGGTTLLNYRSGDPGFSQLAAIEAPFEASAPLGYNGRITAIAHPVFLDSGQANGNAILTVTESTISGSSLVTIPEPIGTLTGTNTTIPAQQNAVGLGGELQLAFPHFAIAGGYTPYNFLVSTFTGRLQWNPGNGPVSISLVRDSEKDSQLSYAGLRDPGQASLSYPGQVWGGVVYDQGEIRIAHGDAQSGFYFSAGGQYLTGDHVENNSRIDGTGGAYWRAFTSPEYGNLSIGANFFAMHYANNQNAFTHGMGGYFSPQGYFLANVPFSWSGHYLTNLHYNIMGAVGAQGFQENSTPLWPLAGDKPLETSQNSPMLPSVTSVSANYDLRSEIAYQIGPHWFAGGYLAANNTRNYSFASVGFFVRFVFREQPSTATAPTGLFPWDGLRPFTVP